MTDMNKEELEQLAEICRQEAETARAMLARLQALEDDVEDRQKSS